MNPGGIQQITINISHRIQSHALLASQYIHTEKSLSCDVLFDFYRIQL
jgi:hypothetical protein